MAAEGELRLGLIGRNIGRSLAPRLHETLGRVHGLRVRYDLLDSEGCTGFDPLATSQECAMAGYAGLNVTHPFKRVMAPHVRIAEGEIARLGSVNTIRFAGDGWAGSNTDYTGFLRAYRGRFGAAAPGRVLIAGAGGMGRAAAFALAALGAARIAIHDLDAALAGALAEELREGGGAAAVALPAAGLAEEMAAADGLLNCTPAGMHPSLGTPFPVAGVKGRRWVFDAVYTPLWTPFLLAAREAGVAVLSGFELFYYQGLDAFRVFTGRETDPEAVREEVAGWVAGEG